MSLVATPFLIMNVATTTPATDETCMDCIENERELKGNTIVNEGQKGKEVM